MKRFNVQNGFIIDDLTGKEYNNLRDICKLLNNMNERADRNAQLYYDLLREDSDE